MDGLPVFGSHVGKAAWGVDLALALRAAADGTPLLVAEEDILVQGALVLSEQFGELILKSLEGVPDVVAVPYLQEQLRQLFLSDKRFLAMDDVQIAQTGVGFDIDLLLIAINGGSIRTGGSPS